MGLSRVQRRMYLSDQHFLGALMAVMPLQQSACVPTHPPAAPHPAPSLQDASTQLYIVNPCRQQNLRISRGGVHQTFKNIPRTGRSLEGHCPDGWLAWAFPSPVGCSVMLGRGGGWAMILALGKRGLEGASRLHLLSPGPHFSSSSPL